MICPYCNKEMLKGSIQSHGETLCWTPETENKGFCRWSTSNNSIPLASFSLFKGSKAIAFCCKGCNKVIVDIPLNT